MTHLSDLDLDRLASGLEPVAAERAGHLAACPACQARVAERTAAATEIRALPGFHQGLDRLDRLPQRPPRTAWRWPWLLVPVAAGLAAWGLIGHPTAPPTERLKGSAALHLVDSGGRILASPLSRGATVRLAVDPQGRREGFVLAVEDGRIAPVWPPSAGSAPVSAGPVGPPLKVTPGTMVLFGFFHDGGLDPAAARAALEAALARCPAPVDPNCVTPMGLPGQATWARAYYSSD